jgi:eukaryotic-like serine/threonine-protein kinase
VTASAERTSCPRCGLSVPAHALSACPRCLLAGLDEPEPLPENPQGLELLEEIGRGGMGRVFRARHAKLDREVAVKLLPAELAIDPTFQARFEREARVLGRMSHPHIVAVHDFGALPDGSGYLVMQYVAGGTLRARLPLPLTEAERVVKQLCSALAYAHAAGVVHRDIKPENVLFDASGRALLADFGIARLLVDEHTALTAPLMVLGTPRYMAPEARAGAPADPRSDVFAVGVLLQEMLGEGGESPLRSKLQAVAHRACAAEPSQRYPSAVELLSALDNAPAAAVATAAPSVPVPAPAASAANELPPEHQSWLRAAALTLAGATGVSLYTLLVSVTPRTLEANEALPLAIFEAQRLADGRLATRARFETWPTLWAAAAWAVALVAYGLLRGQWHRAGLDTPRPEQPVAAVRPVVRMALVLNALFAVHLVLERTALRSIVIYIPILGGMLELFMVYLVWVAVLEALRVSRPLRREPWLWLGALISLIPPVVSSYRLLVGGQP